MPGESFYNATQGAGLKLHTYQVTIGANDVDDEIVRLGDQYLGSYVIDTPAVSIATASDHVLQIMAGATNKVWLRRLRVYQVGLATTAAVWQWQLFRLTTAGTGGGSVATDKLDESDAAAGAAGLTLNTVKGTEGTRLYSGSAGLIQTVPTGGFDPLILDLDFDKNPRLKPVRIAAGTTNGVALKATTGHAGATVQVVAELTEQSW